MTATTTKVVTAAAVAVSATQQSLAPAAVDGDADDDDGTEWRHDFVWPTLESFAVAPIAAGDVTTAVAAVERHRAIQSMLFCHRLNVPDFLLS